MNLHDVKAMIEEGEGFETEFKRKVSSPEKIAKALLAFANTRGGHILFGVDDDGSIVGVESEKTEADLIEYAGRHFCDPPIETHLDIVPFNDKDVIVATVEESDQKPHYLLGEDGEENKVFIRVNDNSVIASREVIKVLRDERADRTPFTVTIGDNEKRLFAYLELNGRIAVSEFAELINVSQRRSSRILTTMVRAGVIRIHTMEKRDYFTLASDEYLTEGTRGAGRTSQSRTPRRR
ncbi:MAG: putative DNA binding domain-containing protein [Ignavibacteriales bacterium]|nr:putative DNA binding domain-containing protein [Ignavibacteriales bacterium]